MAVLSKAASRASRSICSALTAILQDMLQNLVSSQAPACRTSVHATMTLCLLLTGQPSQSARAIPGKAASVRSLLFLICRARREY